jgi:hypothetical protein
LHKYIKDGLKIWYNKPERRDIIWFI